jgi:hypothetical protein
MNFSYEDILRLSEEVSLSKEITLADIPSIDLYMDQITTLFETKLSHLKRDSDEAILTKTMINNYAKAKILTPIKNKKYNRQQIITLILVYNLKQVLSLDDIKALFKPIAENSLQHNGRTTSIDELYMKLLQIKEQQSSEFREYLAKTTELIGDLSSSKNDEYHDFSQLILTVLTLINSATLQKRMAEKLIDEFFKDKGQ